MAHIKQVADYNIAADQKSAKAKKEFVTNLLVMGIIILVGVIIWLVVEVFVLDKNSTVPANVRNVARRIDPLLASEVITVMETRNGFREYELVGFPIFLDDTNNNRGYTENLVLRQKEATRPGDEELLNLETVNHFPEASNTATLGASLAG